MISPVTERPRRESAAERDAEARREMRLDREG